MNDQGRVLQMGERAVAASRTLASLPPRRKNTALEGMAEELERRKDDVLAANEKDLEAARETGLGPGVIEQLALTPARFDATVRGVRNLTGLHDPIGTRISRWIRPNGLVILKVRVPIGVIGIIYEARPTVTVEAAALCIKSGNAVILSGGCEARQSNAALAAALQAGGESKGLPSHAVQMLPAGSEEPVKALCGLENHVDLIIPRGGEAFVRSVIEQARVPVLKHCGGVCHFYVDESADVEEALRLIENAKCQRPAACNSIETVLVHGALAASFIPRLVERLGPLGVSFRGDPPALAATPSIDPAGASDWSAEFMGLILAVRVVASFADAVEHINGHGSHLADAIAAKDEATVKRFLREVDSAAVLANTSTRFTDGIEFGMGADLGISADKLHARGPIGLEELTTYKYLVKGEGQTR